jgi:hypothetical protein
LRNQRFELRAAVIGDSHLRAELRANRPHFILYVAITWIELRRELIFNERCLELAERRQSPRGSEVNLCGTQARLFERRARSAIVGPGSDEFGVFDDRAIEVLLTLG